MSPFIYFLNSTLRGAVFYLLVLNSAFATSAPAKSPEDSCSFAPANMAATKKVTYAPPPKLLRSDEFSGYGRTREARLHPDQDATDEAYAQAKLSDYSRDECSVVAGFPKKYFVSGGTWDPNNHYDWYSKIYCKKYEEKQYDLIEWIYPDPTVIKAKTCENLSGCLAQYTAKSDSVRMQMIERFYNSLNCNSNKVDIFPPPIEPRDLQIAGTYTIHSIKDGISTDYTGNDDPLSCTSSLTEAVKNVWNSNLRVRGFAERVVRSITEYKTHKLYINVDNYQKANEIDSEDYSVNIGIMFTAGKDLASHWAAVGSSHVYMYNETGSKRSGCQRGFQLPPPSEEIARHIFNAYEKVFKDIPDSKRKVVVSDEPHYDIQAQRILKFQKELDDQIKILR